MSRVASPSRAVPSEERMQHYLWLTGKLFLQIWFHGQNNGLNLWASIGFIIALCIDPTMFCDEKHELWKDPEFEFFR